MTEPGSPPLSGLDAGSFGVVPKEQVQLIRKTWETSKRDETDRLGLDVQPQGRELIGATPDTTHLTYSHKFDYISEILEDVN